MNFDRDKSVKENLVVAGEMVALGSLAVGVAAHVALEYVSDHMAVPVAKMNLDIGFELSPRQLRVTTYGPRKLGQIARQHFGDPF